MVIKVRKMTWAKITSGGNGSAMVYTGGQVESDKVVRVDQSEERSAVSFYADDHMIDHDNSVSAATVALELAKITDEMYEDVLGYAKTTTELTVTANEAPYVGVGFIYGYKYCGEAKYRAYWYYKVQFGLGSRSFNTKGETTAYQTESLEGNAMAVQLESGGNDVFYAMSTELDTEAAALTWLRGKAGIS